MVNKVHKAKMQDHPGNHHAIRKVTGKLATTPWITEYLEYLFLQASSSMQHARTRSRSWSRSSRTTNIKNPSFRTRARRRRSTSSAQNRRIWWPTWTTPRSSNFAKILPNSNVLTAMSTGKLVKSICSCGRNMKSLQSPTKFDQNNRDVTSIPGYLIQKNSSRGAKHGPSERQRMCYWAKQMLKKARQQKHGRHPTILSPWYASQTYRDSLCAIGWREKHIKLYNRIALEKHIYVATRAEIIQNSKQWSLTINAERPQQPLNQRPDFAQAERECKRWHDEHLARTQEEYRTIPRSQQVRQRKGQHFESPGDWWIFLRVRRRTTSQPTECLNSTPTNTARTELHIMITLHHANTRGSRAARLSIAHLCFPKTIVIHVSCLVPCRTWHWPQAHVLSHPFHPPIFPTVSPTHNICGPRPTLTLRCSTAEWRINTNPISHTPYAPKSVEIKAIDTEAIAWRLRAQKKWACPESWDRSVSNAGKIHEKL